jgi:hypothetical protein
MLALVAVLGAVLVLATGCAGAGSAKDDETHVIAVSGQGEATGTPDVAYVSLGIESMSEDLSEAIGRANTVMSDVQAAVTGQGVEEKDMQTESFNVWLEEVRNPQTGEPTGRVIYHVSNSLRVTVRAIDTTGGVIGAALDGGANRVNSLSFGIDDTTTLEAEARSKAVADARARAEQLAEALGVTLGAPVNVSESFSSIVPPPSPRYEAAMDSASIPPISSGELTITMLVNVSFAIEK